MISSRGTSLAARKCATGLGFSCFSTSLRSTYCCSRDQQTDYKQLLDEVFVISGKIKVSVSVISLRLRLRLITLTSKSCQDCLSFRIKPTLCGLTVRRPRSIAAPSLLNLSTGEKRRGRDRPRTSENQANTVGRVNKKCIHF